jgi:uncharacterized protein
MADPIFGLVFRRVEEEPTPVIGADLSTIGLIGPADQANPEFFPVNTPVKVYSNDTTLINYIGEAGYMRDAIDGINAQLGELEVAAKLVIVRTAPGTNPDPALRMQETIAHIMGSSVQGSGVWAFLKSPQLLAITPRLICAPGFTGQLANTVGELHIGVVGKGYVPGQSYPMTFSGGGISPSIVQATGHAVADANGDINQSALVLDSFGAWYDEAIPPTVTLPAPPAATTATAHTVITDGGVSQVLSDVEGNGYLPGVTVAVTFSSGGGGGEVEATGHAVANSLGRIGQAEIYLDTPGSGYESAPTVTIAAPPTPVQATLTAELSAGANPVCAMLPAILNQLIAHAIVESAGTSEINDEDWRETIQSDRIIGLSGGVKVMDPDTGTIYVRPLAPRFAGILVRRDHETGYPFHSAANQPVQGIIGPARAIGFSITDDANEGQQLLRNNIGILVRGETGSDFAIASGGFVVIATDNLGESELWRFYNVMRGRDYIHLSLLRALRIYLGRQNITGHTVQAIINTIKFFLRDLQALDQILGFKVEFKGAYNSAEQIRLGHLTVAFAAEEPPVLRKITTLSARYRPAIDAMVQNLERTLNIAA